MTFGILAQQIHVGHIYSMSDMSVSMWRKIECSPSKPSECPYVIVHESYKEELCIQFSWFLRLGYLGIILH